ncbi:MAG: chorismate mutase [Patescibacteria group bacterium]|nr:chorismate mutase [Patescibacteria group bacterium]
MIDKKTKKFLLGIQGGKGSFNEEAAIFYIKKNNLKNCQIKYLYTAEKVLKNLILKKINIGLFAVYNNTGGTVKESESAMKKYKFQIIDKVYLPICHFLMKRKDVDTKKIKKIIGHPQVFLQCKNNLKEKYPNLKCISGKGNMIDTAKAAEALSKGKISKYTAVLGSKRIAQIYDFDIIDENLQDFKNNQTTFIVVKSI